MGGPGGKRTLWRRFPEKKKKGRTLQKFELYDTRCGGSKFTFLDPRPWSGRDLSLVCTMFSPFHKTGGSNFFSPQNPSNFHLVLKMGVAKLQNEAQLI